MKSSLDNVKAGMAGFGRFWWDFLVGDSVALALGGMAVLGIGYLLVQAGLTGAAQVILPLVVAGTIWASLPRSRA